MLNELQWTRLNSIEFLGYETLTNNIRLGRKRHWCKKRFKKLVFKWLFEHCAFHELFLQFERFEAHNPLVYYFGQFINQTILSLAAFSTASALIWASRSASSGTFCCMMGLNHSTGTRGFPEGCFTETEPSAL